MSHCYTIIQSRDDVAYEKTTGYTLTKHLKKGDKIAITVCGTEDGDYDTIGVIDLVKHFDDQCQIEFERIYCDEPMQLEYPGANYIKRVQVKK